jgi:NAD(P)-dependent dehydrogenase (short-subunit alcohol dehydrogenase family)
VRNGAKVVIADVQDDLGCAVAAELEPDKACYTRCDVTDEAQVAAAVDLAVARHGQLDVMFNNAGITGSPGWPPLGAVDLADFDRVMALNAWGACWPASSTPHASWCRAATAASSAPPAIGGSTTRTS